MSDRFDKWEAKIQSRKDTRQSFALQLDWANPDDVELIKIIALLKDNQDFSRVLRMALRIIPALMYEGSLEELFSEFPWIRLEMLEYMQALQPKQLTTHNGVGELKDQFERLEQLILQQKGDQDTTDMKPKYLNPVGSSNGGVQPLSVPQLTQPTFEDDDEDFELTVTKADHSKSNASERFIASMMALQGGT